MYKLLINFSKCSLWEVVHGVLLPWMMFYCFYLLENVPCFFVDLINLIAISMLFFAMLLPFCVSSYREAFEKSFRDGRCLPPASLRCLTILSYAILSILISAIGYPLLGFTFMVLITFDAAFYSWISLYRDGYPPIPISKW